MLKRFSAFFLFIMIITTLNTECTGGGNDLKIYAVRYGRSMFQKKFVFYGDKSAGMVPFSWLCYYIEYGGRKILIDTGFNDAAMVKTFGITGFKDPVAILKENGIDADQITDVIITHSHFDHIGNAHRFKNARFVINRDELNSLNTGKSIAEVKKFFNGNKNVTVFDESIILYDIFNVKKIGGHTKGSSVVLFSYDKINYCFTGDEVYLQDNISGNTGNGSVYSHGNNIKFLNMIADGSYRLFIFHDSRYADMKDRLIKVFPAD